ncbi:uncharacterized protein LOC114171939 [Vigna unguiculata]|uniref:uncharacterized protein LOC114171939 n=1 Tax=Vigna unguiculata TaxID=3917 RepID=UPI00101702D7|nr:uncharacterized protein LOC114171939 [Vigna unguiculata]
MEALREENSRLRQKIEADQGVEEPCQPRSRADIPPNSRVAAPPQSRVDVHPTEDESEYRPTGPTTGGNYSSFASKRNRRHPFIDGITETPLPHKWKAPIVTYDGTTDPDEFISIYTNQVGLYSTDDAVLCKSFSVALRGSALEWFMSLPPYTIDSFTTLTTTFTTQFDTSRRHDLTTIALLNLRQEEGEPLRVFIDRFGAIAMKIKDLTPNLILMYMMTSLQPGPFTDELAMCPPLSMQELRKRAAIRGPAGRTHPPPRKYQNPPNADLSKYCHYHRNNGHTTDECDTLRDKIQELVRAGHLKHYIRETGEGAPRPRYERNDNRRVERRPDRRIERREPRREPARTQHTEQRMPTQPQPRRTDDRPPLRGTINTISGGFAGGGRSSSSRKKHLRAVQSVHAVSGRTIRRMPPITFSDVDFQGTDPNQDDPMVITIEVENFAIKKVLIDQGSSVDILYWKTFNKLQIPLADLTPHDEPIYGFSGERVPTKGYIDLHTTFGEGRQTKTIPIRYLVVEAHTSYNILLGRPSIPWEPSCLPHTSP